MTTITTAKLREMAHTLGTTPGELAFILGAARLSVTIDDTPADTDTEEQTTAMTITQEQFDIVQRLARRMGGNFVLNDGITITPAEPPAEMVKLAREIVAKICDQQQQVREVMIGGWDDHAVMRVALAALQHVEKVVLDAKRYANPMTGDEYAYLPTILTALGAGGRNAG